MKANRLYHLIVSREARPAFLSDPDRTDRIEVVSVDDGEVILFWEVDPKQASRLLKLLRAYLNAGVMENGLVSPTDEGTPQGGPLSPLGHSGRLRTRRKHRSFRNTCAVTKRSWRSGLGSRKILKRRA